MDVGWRMLAGLPGLTRWRRERGCACAGGAAGAEAMASGSSTDSMLVSHLKYQLPSEPHMYVDLVDDEDVQLMFDEVRAVPLQQGWQWMDRLLRLSDGAQWWVVCQTVAWLAARTLGAAPSVQ